MTEVSDASPAREVFYAILGEPIPKNTNLLRTAAEYRHFRTIYAAQKQLNELMKSSSLDAEVRLIMIDRTSDIPRKLWDLSHATCVIIFGPNFPWLSEATIRLWATSGRDRFIVVCHEPKNALFTWDRLREIGDQLNVKGYQSATNEEDSNSFWLGFFNEQLRPLIEQKAAMSKQDIAQYSRSLSGQEVSDVLANDHEAMRYPSRLSPHLPQSHSGHRRGQISYGRCQNHRAGWRAPSLHCQDFESGTLRGPRAHRDAADRSRHDRHAGDPQDSH